MRGEHWTGRLPKRGSGGSSPRAREHGTSLPDDLKEAGSSPRARGTHRRGHHRLGRVRFIPACAGNTRPGRRTRSPCSVHPRVRGEHAHAGSLRCLTTGSSPRARGTPGRWRHRASCSRFIPACAGNTPCGVAGPSALPVHPRVRGEHDMRISVTDWTAVHPRVRGEHGPSGSSRIMCCGSSRVRGEHHPAVRKALRDTGSSPRARGTPARPVAAGLDERFIPACAGNTARKPAPASSLPVHPRVRGEHHRPFLVRPHASGSSPRARGTLQRRFQPVVELRFIPACAGNTSTTTATAGRTTVHPRVRGNTRPPSRRWRSPPVHPRVRGEHSRLFPEAADLTVHPRVRGEHGFRGRRAGRIAGSSPRAREHLRGIQVAWSNFGSSPRARGTPGREAVGKGEGRFIAACAGNTLESCGQRCPIPVHPRVRGEHSQERLAALEAAGSSPRARGTPLVRHRQARLRRFIPRARGTPV